MPMENRLILKETITYYRELAGLSVEQMATEMGITRGYLSDLINGKNKKRWNEDQIISAAKALKCEPSDLTQNRNVMKRLIPLVGLVGAGTTMRCANVMDDPMDWIDPLTVGLSQNFPVGTMFIQVKGNSMVGSADDGDYLWLNSNDVMRGNDIDNMLGKRAVVICKDGFNFYKKIKRGNKKGTYNLHSINTPEIMEDMHLQCAYIVHGVVYR